MQAFIYYLTLPLIYGISWLPFPVLYVLSDFLYFLLYRVFKYRVEVVRENLENSFPEKSEAELRKIERDFYHYLGDLILEALKTLTLTPKGLKERISFEDLSVFERYSKENQSLIAVLGHFGNWEIGGAAFSQFPYHKLIVIYHPLKNKYFEGLVYHMRTRWGNGLYPMRETYRNMARDQDQLTVTAFIADQTPSRTSKAYWTRFLNQDTPVFTGTAKAALKFNYPIIYVSVLRPKRGHYHIHTELLIEDPSQYTEDEISEIHTRRLEKDIKEHPHIWLWTHRRWKHKRKDLKVPLQDA